MGWTAVQAAVEGGSKAIYTLVNLKEIINKPEPYFIHLRISGASLAQYLTQAGSYINLL